jgi:hypothetical protein
MWFMLQLGHTHSITSSYLHQHPDEDPALEFSNQQAMNCLPLNRQSLSFTDGTSDTFDHYQDGGMGCWGGNGLSLYNWLIATGSRMPELKTVPYIGFQGGCDYSVPSIETGQFKYMLISYSIICIPMKSLFISWTGIVRYSIIKSIAQMKNALYFRGDVGTSVSASNMPGRESSDISAYSDNFTWPSDDQDLHEQGHLGRGISVPKAVMDHAVAVIGWGPCTVTPCNSDSDEEIESECLIGKYFCPFVALLVN